MHLERRKTCWRVISALALSSLGCIDFDRVGRPPPAETAFAPQAPNAVDYTAIDPIDSAEATHLFPEVLAALDDSYYQDYDLLNAITLGWLISGMVLLALFTVLSYRRWRPTRYRRHGIGSTIQPLPSSRRGHPPFEFPTARPEIVSFPGPITAPNPTPRGIRRGPAQSPTARRTSQTPSRVSRPVFHNRTKNRRLRTGLGFKEALCDVHNVFNGESELGEDRLVRARKAESIATHDRSRRGHVAIPSK